MAMLDASYSPAPSAQLVGNVFVEQYYHILHQSPKLVHRFYQDSSLLSRPESNGAMMTVTTMQAINDKILSLKYEDYMAEIKTADAQGSHEKGVIVLVTGCLIGKDNVGRQFTQTFFLAPQENGYFVLNDVFRYVEENESLRMNSVSVNSINDNAQTAALTPEPGPTHAPDHLVVDQESSCEEENLNNGDEVCSPLDNGEESLDSGEESLDNGEGSLDNGEGSVVDVEIVEPPTHSSQDQIPTGAGSTPAVQGDAPKISYASIVRVMKGNGASPVYIPTSTVRAAPTNTDQQSLGSAKSAVVPEASAPISYGASESNNIHEEAEGHSIYVRNLPFDATDALLEEEFKKFGPIKHNGIQVRSNKQGSCFGFVEFETLSSMHSAVEASPLTIGDCQAVVEEKRTNSRLGSSGRGRYSSGRGGFRNDNFRGRGNYVGGWGYARNEFRNQGEFSGRPRGSSSGRNGESYLRVNQNGSGRGGRQGGVNRNSVPFQI